MALLIVFIFGLHACEHAHHDHGHYHPHPILYATLYQQQAAEYRALCYQAFNLASLQLNNEITAGHDYPLAVVVDIDETILDNSPYQAQAIEEGFGYPKKWAEWVNMAAAKPVPGALAFLQEAAEKGAKVFYVTNRKEEFREATLANLKEFGFPDATDGHLLMRTTTNDKDPRRKMILEQYHIAVLVGDNLGDFDGAFDTTDASQRMQLTDAHQDKFGTKWIMLPNAIYGAWVMALHGYEHGIHPDELAKQLQQNLEGF